jgi:hypothetical protein
MEGSRLTLIKVGFCRNHRPSFRILCNVMLREYDVMMTSKPQQGIPIRMMTGDAAPIDACLSDDDDVWTKVRKNNSNENRFRKMRDGQRGMIAMMS